MKHDTLHWLASLAGWCVVLFLVAPAMVWLVVTVLNYAFGWALAPGYWGCFLLGLLLVFWRLRRKG